MKEKKGNTRTLKDEVQVMKGDKVPLNPMNLEAPLMEEHVDAIPLDPLPPNPMNLLGNLVDVL